MGLNLQIHTCLGKSGRTKQKTKFNNLENMEMLDILHRAISRDQIKEVITKLKNGKAAGIDRIIREILRELDDNSQYCSTNFK